MSKKSIEIIRPLNKVDKKEKKGRLHINLILIFKEVKYIYVVIFTKR